MPSSRRSRNAFVLLLTAMVLTAGACGDASSPTEPNLPPSVTGALTGQAVVSGELVQGGGGGFAGSSLGATPAGAAAGVANVVVSVVGSPISDTTDSSGHFRLPNAPDGDVRLRFTGGGLNAELALSGVAEALTITVQVQGSSVQLLSSSSSPLEHYNELALSTSITDPVNDVGTIALERGDTAAVDDMTIWDPKGDYFSLTELEGALTSGLPVKVKGQGTRDPVTGMILTSQIRAKMHTPADEFNGPVASATGVDPDGIIMLASNSKGSALQVNTQATTAWDAGGDYKNFTELLAAVNAGLLVNVEGDGALDPSGTFILAGTIKATKAIAEFDGPVTSASGVHPNGTILLSSNSKGPILQVNTDMMTVWDLSGDYGNLNQLVAGLGALDMIHVEGDGQVDITGTFILAATIKAETIVPPPPPGGPYGAQILAIQNLINDVLVVAASNNLNNGQTNSLTSKLDNAIKDLTKGNANPAVGKLNAFINEVNALAQSGKIVQADATALIQAAQAIIASLP